MRLIQYKRMKKPEIANQLARRSGVSQAEAADRVDLVVRRILARLREGKDASLPGLGRFAVDKDGQVIFERERGGNLE